MKEQQHVGHHRSITPAYSIADVIRIFSGKAITCYHGSNREFDSFDPEAETNVWDADYPDGVMFFTNTADRAQLYGRYVYTCRLNVNAVKHLQAPENQSPERYIDNNYEVFNHLFQDSDCIAVTGRGKYQNVIVYALTDENLIRIVGRKQY